MVGCVHCRSRVSYTKFRHVINCLYLSGVTEGMLRKSWQRFETYFVLINSTLRKLDSSRRRHIYDIIHTIIEILLILKTKTLNLIFKTSVMLLAPSRSIRSLIMTLWTTNDMERVFKLKGMQVSTIYVTNPTSVSCSVTRKMSSRCEIMWFNRFVNISSRECCTGSS